MYICNLMTMAGKRRSHALLWQYVFFVLCTLHINVYLYFSIHIHICLFSQAGARSELLHCKCEIFWGDAGHGLRWRGLCTGLHQEWNSGLVLFTRDSLQITQFWMKGLSKTYKKSFWISKFSNFKDVWFNLFLGSFLKSKMVWKLRLFPFLRFVCCQHFLVLCPLPGAKEMQIHRPLLPVPRLEGKGLVVLETCWGYAVGCGYPKWPWIGNSRNDSKSTFCERVFPHDFEIFPQVFHH